MSKKHLLNAAKIEALADVLRVLHGVKVDLTINVSIEELVKLSPEQIEVFLHGISQIVAANPKVALDENE